MSESYCNGISDESFTAKSSIGFKNKGIWLVNLTVLVILTVIDLIYGELFIHLSARLSSYIQGYESDAVNVLSWIASNILVFWIFPYLWLSYIFSTNKSATFWNMSLFGFGSYFVFVLKIIYHDTRPFLMYKECAALACSCDFGKPSAHAQKGLMIYFILFNQFISLKFMRKVADGVTGSGSSRMLDDRILGQQQRNLPTARTFLYFVVGIIFTSIVFWIGFSRIVLGQHSFNQIILGFYWSWTIC